MGGNKLSLICTYVYGIYTGSGGIVSAEGALFEIEKISNIHTHIRKRDTVRLHLIWLLSIIQSTIRHTYV